MFRTVKSSFLAAALASASVHGTMAQGLPDNLGDAGDFEIEENRGGRDWGQYIGGTAGAVTADGDTIGRQLAALQLDINLPATDRLKTIASIDFVDFENSYTQRLRENVLARRQRCEHVSPDATPIMTVDELPDDASAELRDQSLDWENNRCSSLVLNGAFLPEERETDVADSFVDFREAYVQWEANDYATLTLGRQNLVWGQFEFLSPVGFLLPFRGTNTSPRPRRADFSFAQDGVNLSVFPTGNSEVQLIHVPQMRLDPSVEENLKSYSELRYCGLRENGDFDCPTGFAFPDIGDYDMSALRFTYYGQNLIFTATALDGTQVSFDPYRDALLRRDDAGHFSHQQDNRLTYDDLETVAVEFSYVLNLNWTLKGEYTAFETKEAVNLPFRGDDIAGAGDLDQTMAEAIVDVNGGKPYINNDVTFLALGVEYEGEDWFGHLQIVNFDFESASAADAVLECIEDLGTYVPNAQNPAHSTCGGAQDDDDDGVAPIFFIARRLGETDDGFVGFGATAFFNAYGAGFFGGWRLNESIEFGGFVGAVVDVANTGPPSDSNYESVDDGDALAQIGISYLF